MSEIKIIDLSEIRIDGGTRMREKIVEAVYLEYAELMESGTEFEPMEVYWDGSSYWLADGFHGYWAQHERWKKLQPSFGAAEGARNRSCRAS
jgi:hypothetical protein